MTNTIEKFNEEELKAIISQPTGCEISFSVDISTEDLINSLKTVYDYENSLQTVPNIVLDLKNVPTDCLIEAFRYSMKREDLVNSSMLLNILNLIKTYNSLDEDFFSNPNVYFTALQDLLDVKMALKPDLDEFITKLSRWYLSIIKSMYKFEFTYLDKHYELPKIYRRIILSTDFLTLSGILSKAKTISTDELVLVDDAYWYMSELSSRMCVGNRFMEKIL